MHLLLVGLRGSGKTTLGRLLADLAPRPFIDLDERTSALAGQDAASCFAEHGEARWRELESQAFKAALQEEPSVIALGGGTPTAPGVLECITQAQADSHARVAWLDAPDQVLLDRIGSDDSRPALTELSPGEEMQRIREERDPIYTRIAQVKLDTSTSSRDEILARLAELLH